MDVTVPEQPWTASVLRRLASKEPVEAIVADLFAPGGPVTLCGLDPRPAQVQLARLAGRRAAGGWALAESPTGSGKSLAYLVPGLLAVRRARDRYKPEDGKANRPPRLVVSTANQSLQEQLVAKDVRLAATILGLSTSVAPAMGRSNYACVAKLNDSRLAPLGLQPEAFAAVQRLGDWYDRDLLGDGHRDRLPGPVDGAAWARCSTDTEGCLGEGCPHDKPSDGFAPCFANLARAEAARSEVVIVNHHWLARGWQGLGPVALLAVDEAHAFEDALRGAGIRSLGRGAPYTVQRLVTNALGKSEALAATAAVKSLLAAARRYLDEGGQSYNGSRRELTPGWCARAGGPSLADLDVLDVAAAEVDMRAAGEGDKQARARHEHSALQLRAVARKARACIAAAPTPDHLATTGGPWVAWAEVDGDGASLGYAPADVAPLVTAMRRALPRALLTSATLDASIAEPALGLVDGQAGAPTEPGVALPSPWPLASMGVLVVPRGPTPKEPGWRAWATAQAIAAVRAASGRTLVLCASWAGARATAEALRADCLPWPVLCHGEQGRHVLAAAFRDDRDSVLVATRSFFEGLDVQGDSCSCVVIEKVPFDVPGDPLADLAAEVVAGRVGGSPFLARALPRATAQLAQAAGRLLRSATDRGALVVLDSRVAENSIIGAACRKALPPFPLSRDLDDVGRVLRGEAPRLLGPGQVAAAARAAPASIPIRRNRGSAA